MPVPHAFRVRGTFSCVVRSQSAQESRESTWLCRDYWLSCGRHTWSRKDALAQARHVACPLNRDRSGLALPLQHGLTKYV